MPKNLGGHVTMATSPFRKIFKGSCPDCPWEHAGQIWTPYALIVLNWFGWLVRCVQTQRDRQTDTSNENSISAVHLIHLAEITSIIVSAVVDESHAYFDLTRYCDCTVVGYIGGSPDKIWV